MNHASAAPKSVISFSDAEAHPLFLAEFNSMLPAS
jgi:hypothetical protein